MTLTAPQALNLWRVALVESLRRGGPDLTEAALTLGASVALVRRFSASGYWADVRKSGATVGNMLGSMANILWGRPPSRSAPTCASAGASDFKYTVVFPDGREQGLLTVPRYDDTWQFAYRLATPLQVPAGAKLVVVAHYNNSASNRTVKSPAQPGGDMFMPVMQYSVAVGAGRSSDQQQ